MPLLQMGLGKTAQSISVLAFQKQYGGCRGPFLGKGWQQAAQQRQRQLGDRGQQHGARVHSLPAASKAMPDCVHSICLCFLQ
jgi:hypothetical protein